MTRLHGRMIEDGSIDTDDIADGAITAAKLDASAAASQGANTFAGTQTIASTDAGATTGPVLELYRNSASSAAADDIGEIRFQGKDDGGGLENYAKVRAVIVDATAASEDGKLTVHTVQAGTSAERLAVGGGLWMAGATGGDPGAGKINATGLQVNGVALAPSDYVEIRDEKAAGTDAGTFTSGAWQTRTLNTEASDASNLASLSSNQITLAAGTYVCDIECPAGVCANHQAKLYNVTDASDVLIGTSEYTDAGNTVYTKSRVTGRFTIAASKALEVRHRCGATKATDGFGKAANFGVTEVYAVARFWRVG